VKGQAARTHYGPEGAGGVVRIVTVEGEARTLGIPVQELRERLEAEKAARARVVTGTPKPAKESSTAEVIEVLPDPSFDAREVEPAGVVKVRPATGTVRAEPTGEVSPREALKRTSVYVEKTGVLIVVDGDVRTSLQEVDPKTVKSIDVVKGLAARAVYGERAAKGAVVIRTTNGGEAH
jgi:hypothetical protein